MCCLLYAHIDQKSIFNVLVNRFLCIILNCSHVNYANHAISTYYNLLLANDYDPSTIRKAIVDAVNSYNNLKNGVVKHNVFKERFDMSVLFKIPYINRDVNRSIRLLCQSVQKMFGNIVVINSKGTKAFYVTGGRPPPVKTCGHVECSNKCIFKASRLNYKVQCQLCDYVNIYENYIGVSNGFFEDRLKAHFNPSSGSAILQHLMVHVEKGDIPLDKNNFYNIIKCTRLASSRNPLMNYIYEAINIDIMKPTMNRKDDNVLTFDVSNPEYLFR